MMQDARVRQADLMAFRTQDIADELRLKPEVTMPQVQAAKLYCENTRWYAGRINRAVYGDDPTLNVATQVNVRVPQEKLSSIRERLEAARGLIPPPEKEKEKQEKEK